jgi:glycosyltransferase involved in cell wall biosynthesis
MKIYFDSQIFQLQKVGGISRYFSELVVAILKIEPDYPLQIGARFVRNEFVRSTGILDLKKAPSFIPKVFLLWFYSRKRKFAENTLVHTTYYDVSFLKSLEDFPFIMTVHDMIPEDLSNSTIEEAQNCPKGKYVQQCRGIICVSEFTKNRLLYYFPNLKVPIAVIPLGTNLKLKYSKILNESSNIERGSTFIFVGPRGGYKNFPIVLEAVGKLKRELDENIRILCVGGGSFSRIEEETIRTLGLDRIVFQVNLNDQQLAKAYLTSKALLFPSLNEGFGIPQIEAYSFGCPVLSSGQGALSEFDGGLSIKFKHSSADDLASKMRLILETDLDVLNELSKRLIRHSDSFSWEKTAMLTLDFYKQFF